MLTVVIDGDAPHVTAERFRTLVDVTVRILRDGARDTGIDFTLAGLHAPTLTMAWEPQPADGTGDEDGGEAFAEVAERVLDGLGRLEDGEVLPGWMTARTARALHRVAAELGEGPVESILVRAGDRERILTRATHGTLERILHEETEALGSVTGTLITATLWNGSHVTVREERHRQGVRCLLGEDRLREAGRLIGQRVTVTGKVRRDFRGRPETVEDARLEPAERSPRVEVAEMSGALEGGPDSVEWLRSQRGR